MPAPAGEGLRVLTLTLSLITACKAVVPHIPNPARLTSSVCRPDSGLQGIFTWESEGVTGDDLQS